MKELDTTKIKQCTITIIDEDSNGYIGIFNPNFLGLLSPFVNFFPIKNECIELFNIKDIVKNE